MALPQPVFTNFRTFTSQVAPTALQGPVGQKYLDTMSVPWDALAAAGGYAVRLRYPFLASDDSLPWIAKDRLIQRGPSEGFTSYATRLTQWLDLWVHAGSAPAILLGVASFFLPGTITAELVKQSRSTYTDWDYWDGSTDTLYRVTPKNWDWDSDGYVPCDSRFQQVNRQGTLGPYWHTWVVLYGTGLANDGTWNDPGTWDDGGTWDTNATVDQVTAIRGQVAQWKSAAASVQWIIVSLDSTYFRYTLPAADPKLPDGHMGRAGKVITSGGSRVYTPSRFTIASYWDGM
jgi:hypothetical protein